MKHMVDERPSAEENYLDVALKFAERATCRRRKYGAVIVNNKRVVSTGYCGAPKGEISCLELGECYREERNIPSGQNYELCRSVHAEHNATIFGTYIEMVGGTIYVAGMNAKTGELVSAKPCMMCRRDIINAQLKEVVYREADGSVVHVNVSDWVKEANENPYKDLDAILAKNPQ
jgi:dCMP deaminase